MDGLAHVAAALIRRPSAELRTALLWGTIALVMCVVLLIVSLALATGLLAVLWILLQWLAGAPRWIRGRFS